MSKADVLVEALRVGEALERRAGGQPVDHIPLREAALCANLEGAPHFTKTQARHMARDLGLPEPIHIGSNLYAVVAAITPRMAYRWLLRNDLENRVPTDAQLAALARDISAGKFVLMDQAISFNADGRLENGQHRCWAVLVAQQPIKAMVVLNLPPKARTVIDQTVRRSARHLIKLFGGKLISGHQEAVVRKAMFGMANPQRVSVDEVIGFVSDNRRAFEWLFRRFNRNIPRVTVAPVEACVFRAYVSLGADQRVRLCQFADYLTAQQFSTGRYSAQRDGAVAQLRDWLLGASGSRKRHHAGGNGIYAVTAHSLLSFLDGSPGAIGQAEEDPFKKPVPVLDRDDPFSVHQLLENAKRRLGLDDPAEDV